MGGEAGVSFIIKGVTITVKLYGPPSASNVMNSFKPKGVVRNSTYKCSRPKRWLKYSHSHKPVVSKTLEKGYHFQLSIFVCSAYCCGQRLQTQIFKSMEIFWERQFFRAAVPDLRKNL